MILEKMSDINLNESKQSIDEFNISFTKEDLDKSGSDIKTLGKDKLQHQEKKAKRELDRKKKEIEKEEERKRKEIEKEEERKKKELEKEEEKKRKEIEKEEERKKKEDEKRKRDEERRLKQIEKDDEKKKRDEEKRLKDAEREEKKRKDEEKRKEESLKKKPTTTILNFFQKKIEKTDQDANEMDRNLQCVGIFKPLEVKKDMRMAAVERYPHPLIDSIIKSDQEKGSYLDEIRNKEPLTADETWPILEPDCCVINSLIPRLRAKSFLFNENVRPPFYGTWRKTSAIIEPLNPLAEDIEFFNYENDSDEEWECESGEDISKSEGEVEEEVNEDDDNSFIVPHEYLSDGEGCSDVDAEVDGDPDNIRVIKRKRSLSPKSRQSLIEIREKQFQAEVNQKVQRIDPKFLGPYFTDLTTSQQYRPILEPFKMIVQHCDGIPINCNNQSDFDTTACSTKMKGVPVDAVAHLVRLLHHNSLSRVKICYEFRMYWEYHLTGRLPDVTFEDDVLGKDWDEFTIGKKRLVNKIKEIAERKDGKWIVKPEVIHEYQLCCKDDDPLKECSEQWKYVSNILKIEMTKKVQKKPRTTIVNENKPIVPKERKQSQKRKHTAMEKVDVTEPKFNPSVVLKDDAKQKMINMNAKRRKVELVSIDLTTD